MPEVPVGRLEKVVIDCPEPRALAPFYCAILGMRVVEDRGWDDDPLGWVVIGRGLGLREVAFQRARPWVPPRWPSGQHPHYVHLDIRVADADFAERVVVSLGATRVPGDREQGFRVFTDPAGHPFCLVGG